MVAELYEYLVLRSDPQRLRRRDHAKLGQNGHEPLQCRALAPVDRVLPSSIAEIPLDHALIDVSHLRLRAAAFDPLHEVADQAEAPQTAFLSEPLFSETRRVQLDELSVGSILEPTEYPAPAQVLFCNHQSLLAVESEGR